MYHGLALLNRRPFLIRANEELIGKRRETLAPSP